jgi:predicted nucleic acid-binding protein
MDCCCLNRPFDDQLQDRIRLESDAVNAILAKCADGEWRLVGSDALDLEISKTPNVLRKSQVLRLYQVADRKIKLNEQIKNRARDWVSAGLGAFVSLHAACAEFAKVDVLLTTDKRLINLAKRCDLAARVENPVNWFLKGLDNG